MQENTASRIRLRNFLISVATCVALLVMAYFYAVPVLRISVVTDEPPFAIKRKIKPLTEYLEDKVGMKVEFRPMKDGNALVEALLASKLDIVWIDGLGFGKALAKGGVLPIARLEEAGQPAASGSGYRWAVRADMDGGLREKLTDAFLTMHTDKGKGKEFLLYQHASRYVAVQ